MPRTFMQHRYRLWLAASIALAIAVPGTSARAQGASSVQAVVINAAKGNGLSVFLTSGFVQNLTLVDNGISTGATPIGITSTWDVNPGKTGTVKLVAYFQSASAALSDGAATPNLIPSSRVEGRMASGLPTSYTAMTQNSVGAVGTNGASLTLFNETITGINKQRTRNDVLDIRINLTGGTAPIGSYTGTLKLQAIAQ